MDQTYDFGGNTTSKWIGSAIYGNYIDENEIINLIKATLIKKSSLKLNGWLIIACHKSENNKNTLLIKELINLGADKETVSVVGSTPLLFLCQNNNVDLVKYFVEDLGANIFAKNSANVDCLGYANSKELKDYLIEARKKYSTSLEELTKKNKEYTNRIKELENDKSNSETELKKQVYTYINRIKELENDKNNYMDRIKELENDTIHKLNRIKALENSLENDKNKYIDVVSMEKLKDSFIEATKICSITVQELENKMHDITSNMKGENIKPKEIKANSDSESDIVMV